MKRLVSIFAALLLLLGAVWAAEDERAKELDRIDSAAKVLREIMNAPDKGIPEEILSNAECVAVVPSMVKGGFIVGANYGKGVATCRNAGKWSAPAPFKIEGGSFGLQIGGQAVDLVMLIMNDEGMKNLLDSKFKIGADASAAAGPVGRHVEGDTDWKLRAQVLTYSRARGAFAGITLNGAAIHQDDDATRALYGKEVPFRSILTGKVPAPAGAEAFLAAVRQNFVVARANERREERRERAEKQAESSAAGTTSGGTSGTVAGSTSAPSSKSESSTTAVGSSTQTTTSSAGTSSGAMTQSPAGASASADVKSKIEDALRNEPNLSSSNVQINVTENTVELSGSVPTASDKATVRRIVEANAGGRRVVDDKLIVK